jgi:hypothetical protein
MGFTKVDVPCDIKMPAIQLAHLRQRCAEIAGHFDQPDILVSDLHALFSLYADRTHRTGQTGEPPPLLLTYNVPKPVLRQLLIEIKPRIATNRLAAFQLCDLLWREEYYEMRLLATTVLGLIAPTPPDPALERVEWWIKTTPDEQFQRVVFEQALYTMRTENPERLISQINEWLSGPDIKEQKIGLMALNPLIKTSVYTNLPTFYRLIAPLVRSLPTSLRDNVRETIESLAKRSPIETAHFLRQHLLLSENQDAAWLTRQCIEYFPADLQESLRSVLRANPKN